jgi:Cys-rich repeat protein
MRRSALACLIVAACANGDAVDDGAPTDDDAGVATGTDPGTGPDAGANSTTDANSCNCAAGQVCDPNTHACVECLGNGDCPAGKLCDLGTKTCAAGCDATHACDNGRSCCNGACVATNTVTACSACGLACDTAHSTGASCDGGSCGYAGCAAGYGDCKTAPPNADGCETKIDTPTDCGACGRACSTANVQGTPTCTNGACNSACQPNFGNCNQPVAGPDGGVAVDDGCESNLVVCQGTPCCGTLCGKHDNGAGGTYVDCVDPLGQPGNQATYNANMVNLVVKSFAGANQTSTSGNCFNQYSCAAAYNSNTGECMVWCFTGAAAGYMKHTTDNSCTCPQSTSDAKWN